MSTPRGRIVSRLAAADEVEMTFKLVGRAWRTIRGARVGMPGDATRWMRWRTTPAVLAGLVRHPVPMRSGEPAVVVHPDYRVTLFGLTVVVDDREGIGAPWLLTLEVAT
jgi:hypothetical protein